MSRRATMALLAFSVAGCGADTSADSRGEPVLLVDEEAPADTLERHLVALHRQLIDALRQRDGAAVGRLVEGDFTAWDTRRAGADPTSLLTGAEKLSFMEVMAGRLADRLDPEYQSFRTASRGDLMVVYATGAGDGLRTAWRRLPDGWKASQLMILHPVAVRQLIESH